jgi:hypothetical protein
MFSRRTMEEHWQSGYHDMTRTLAYPQVLQRPQSPGRRLSRFDLTSHAKNRPAVCLTGSLMARFGPSKVCNHSPAPPAAIGKKIASAMRPRAAQPVIADLEPPTPPTATARGDHRPRETNALAVAMNVTGPRPAVDKGGRRGRMGPVDVRIDLLVVATAGIQIVHPMRRLFLCRLEEAAVDPSRRRVPDDQGLLQQHVTPPSPGRASVTHGLGPFHGSSRIKRPTSRPSTG